MNQRQLLPTPAGATGAVALPVSGAGVGRTHGGGHGTHFGSGISTP